MEKLSKKQHIQEDRYKFPYHYIPYWDGKKFHQTRSLKWGYVYMSYLHFLIDKINGTPFENLLDVGCGDGRLLFEINKIVTGKRLVGIDYSRQAIEFARLMVPSVEWICGDITDKMILNEKFDIISLVETLEHIPPHEIKIFIEGLHFYLRNEGLLLLSVPSNNVRVDKKHYQHFDLETLTLSLSPLFEIQKVYYLNKKSIVIRKVFRKILENKLFLLNERHLLNGMYRFYNRFFLIADKKNCTRIALLCKRSKAIKLDTR